MLLDQLANNIDNANAKEGKIVLLGHYNINNLDKSEWPKLETVVFPYDLHVKNKTPPTRLIRIKALLITLSLTAHL